MSILTIAYTVSDDRRRKQLSTAITDLAGGLNEVLNIDSTLWLLRGLHEVTEVYGRLERFLEPGEFLFVGHGLTRGRVTGLEPEKLAILKRWLVV